ncbi:hypothetical protein Taro_003814 [Colocasia esculenta]|uniref:Vacuolar cation/proton exchanger n=1 Tax=Colocasia esculenta TaxID=4460 RepID=A0A843TPU7_COLES|nr:hypothetical protein [Colocasia esculenta]
MPLREGPYFSWPQTSEGRKRTNQAEADAGNQPPALQRWERAGAEAPFNHLLYCFHVDGSMGHLEENTDEEKLVGLPLAPRKIHSFDISQPSIPKQTCNGVFSSISTVLFKAKINLLLPFGPMAIFLHYLTEKNVMQLNSLPTTQALQLLPLTVGGLLNATFGNATEMIISIYALKNGMIRVVQQSLLGSILSNMLLVLGCAFLAGGIVHYRKDQVFNKAAAVVNSGLLLMAVMGLTFPAVLHFTHSEVQYGKSEMALSRFSSCVMLVAYVFYLVFQLKSHRNLYNPINEEDVQTEDDSSEDEEEPEISLWEAIIWLAVLTVWISVLSGYLVDAIQGASESMNMPVAFISVILLPIVGNAAEHASAVMFAMKDKLVGIWSDITLGVAIGSSTQISMFVEGTSNYFKGLMLILCYLIVAASFFVHVDPSSKSN